MNEHEVEIRFRASETCLRLILDQSDGGRARQLAIDEFLHSMLDHLIDSPETSSEPIKYVRYNRAESRDWIDSWLREPVTGEEP